MSSRMQASSHAATHRVDWSVMDVSKNSSGNLFAQILAALQREPLDLLRFAWATLRGTAGFLLDGPGPGLAWRAWLIWRFLLIQLCVPGGVNLLEALRLARSHMSAKRDGVVVEIGSWKGLSACGLSLIAKELGQRMVVIDTFAGLPVSAGPFSVSSGRRRTYRFELGSFAGTWDEVRSNLRRFGCTDIVHGIAADVTTIDKLPFDGTPVAFAFIDVDIPASYFAALRLLAPAIGDGTRICLHEGLLQPVLEQCRDPAFWHDLGLTVPQVDLIEQRDGFRTLLTELTFSSPPRS